MPSRRLFEQVFKGAEWLRAPDLLQALRLRGRSHTMLCPSKFGDAKHFEHADHARRMKGGIRNVRLIANGQSLLIMILLKLFLKHRMWDMPSYITYLVTISWCNYSSY